MPEIHISVKDKVATGDGSRIVCGNSDYMAVFSFDEEWAAYDVKTARFVYPGGAGDHIDVIFEGDTCPVPVLHNTIGVKVGVFAGDLHTTTSAWFDCDKSILCGGGPPADPLPDVYAQIMELIQGLGDPDPEAIVAAVAEYMTKNPIRETDPTVPEWAKSEEKPSYTADEVGAISLENLAEATEAALRTAKESGEFDGKNGDPGAPGYTPQKGTDYWTPADRQQIVKDVLDELPEGGGGINVEAYGLPMLYLTGSTEGISKDQEVALTYIYGERSGSCTLKWQGSSSLSYPKKNYTIKFDTAFEAVEGWGEEKKYCLKANFIDFSHARNIVSARLWGEVVKSRASYESLPELLRSSPNQGAVDGFPICLVINEVYQGIYTWNIPKDKWMFGMGDGESEAVICANQHHAACRFETLAVCDETDFEIEYVPDDENAQWAVDSLNTLIRAVMTSDGSDLDSVIAQRVDIDSAIDWYIFITMLSGADNYDKNYILATYDGVKWFFTPYDMDGTWGLSPGGNSYYRAASVIPTIENFNHKLIKLLANFKTDAVKSRYATLRETVLSESNVAFVFSNFLAKIPLALYQEEVRLWPSIPGSSANSLAQILENYRLRVIAMDKQVDELEAIDIIPAPMLANVGNWYRGVTDVLSITQIDIVSSYQETGEEAEVFNADETDNGNIRGYVNGTTLTLAPTNGARKVALHTTSTGVFSRFKNVERINGTELLTVSAAGKAFMLSAFDGLSKLTSKITLPEGVTSMASCFNACSSMTEPSNIPSTVTDLNSAFMRCSALLTTPEIPSNFTGDCAAMLNGCSGLTTLDGFIVPDGVTNMAYIFTNCFNVRNSTVTVNAQSLTKYNDAFLNVAIDTWATVTLVGTSPFLAELAGTNTHGRVVVGEV